MTRETIRFIAELRERASQAPRSILFPEAADERTLDAVGTLATEGIVRPILVLDPGLPESHERVCRVAEAAGAEVVDPSTHFAVDAVRSNLLARRSHRGLGEAEAVALALRPLYFADGLLAIGEADGCVAGAVHTTSDVLRAALWSVGPAEGVKTVSSAFYMAFAEGHDAVASGSAGDRVGKGVGAVLTFTDCAVVPYPSAEQLADIAVAAADDRGRIVGDEPVVALLSFSTRGSASGESVERVRDAVRLIRSRRPQLRVDGELQVDAAIEAGVAARKAPDSAVAGRANVLVFPGLDAGNIAYKLVQRLAGARAVGPVVQGLARPCSDLSRGASVDDIIDVAAVTALQVKPE